MMTPSAYTTEQVEQWRQQLEDLARQPKTQFSKKEVVEALIEPIQQALAIHSYEQVAQSLKQWGLDITAGSLKQYVTRYQRQRHSKRSSKRKQKSKRELSQPLSELDVNAAGRELSSSTLSASNKAGYADTEATLPAPKATRSPSQKKTSKLTQPLPEISDESELEKEFNL
ncbi:MAG: hypothetical protein F6K19_38495 [Cyanothece sp. SIO1E1]|nr:hypothetical protein [Cyanothece sp. SIO1E1]